MAWIALQVRRAVWVVKDLAFCTRALVEAARYARGTDDHVAIGLLEGQAWAVAGRVNAYRLRLVNDTPEPLRVELEVRGEAEGSRPLELCSSATLPRHGVSQLFVLTDWKSRFELAEEPPATDGLEFLAPGTFTGQCRLVARVESADRPVDEAVIVQPLAT